MDKNPKRERFFKIATKLLSEKGYKAMTMRDLAEALNCDKSNIYNYTNSKQELLDTLIFEIADKFHQGLAEIEASSYTALDKLKAVIRLHVRMTFESPGNMSVHINEWRFLQDGRKKHFLKRRKEYEEKIAEIVTAGIQEGIFRKGEPEFIRSCILSSIRWIYTWDAQFCTDQNPVEVEKNITEFILSGIQLSPN